MLAPDKIKYFKGGLRAISYVLGELDTLCAVRWQHIRAMSNSTRTPVASCLLFANKRVKKSSVKVFYSTVPACFYVTKNQRGNTATGTELAPTFGPSSRIERARRTVTRKRRPRASSGIRATRGVVQVPGQERTINEIRESIPI